MAGEVTVTEAVDRVWLVMESVAVANPGLSMKDGVLLAQKVYKEIDWMRSEGISDPPRGDGKMHTDKTTPADWETWTARTKVLYVSAHCPDTADEVHRQLSGAGSISGSKIIPAIRTLRAELGIGLKEAKDIVEVLFKEPYLVGWTGSRST